METFRLFLTMSLQICTGEFLKFRNEIKNKTYQTVVTVTKSNRKLVQTEATSIVHKHIFTHIHDHLLSCLGIETYIYSNSYLIHDVIPLSVWEHPPIPIPNCSYAFVFFFNSYQSYFRSSEGTPPVCAPDRKG